MPRAELTLFAHIAARPDAEIDLAQAALLIAEDEYPGLDVSFARGVIARSGSNRTSEKLSSAVSHIRNQLCSAEDFL